MWHLAKIQFFENKFSDCKFFISRLHREIFSIFRSSFHFFFSVGKRFRKFHKKKRFFENLINGREFILQEILNYDIFQFLFQF